MTTVAVLFALLTQTPMRLPNASGGSQPVYRPVKSGEQREQGLLRRIVCAQNTPVRFIVQQKVEGEKERVLQFTAPRLTDVEFLDYRKQSPGAVTCEGFGAGVPVFLTWKPDGKTQRAVAVEFLSK